MKRKIIRIIKITIIIYFVAGVILYLFQDKILFHPVVLPQNYAYHFDTEFEEINVHADDKSSYNIIKFLPQNGSAIKGAVLYFHGNRENINHYAEFAPNFTRRGYEVWMCDYPGFGKSTGTLNEQALYDEALQLYKMARAKGFSTDSIIIYGKSIGTGIAAQLAGIRDCKRLILESPYYSATALAQHYFRMFPVRLLMHFKIPTYEFFPEIKAPITIFHGTDDGTIPYNQAEELKSLMKHGDELISIEGGHHNDLNDFPLMKRKLDSLLTQ